MKDLEPWEKRSRQNKPNDYPNVCLENVYRPWCRKVESGSLCKSTWDEETEMQYEKDNAVRIHKEEYGKGENCKGWKTKP